MLSAAGTTEEIHNIQTTATQAANIHGFPIVEPLLA